MTWKPRLIDPAELGAVADVTAIAFGAGPTAPAGMRETFLAAAEVDRTFVVDDGDDIIGTGGAYTFEVTVPGGTALPLTAVTWVGVRPTHRRQGVLSALMDALIDQAIDRGEPLAGLTASEGGIYRRFGYGVAARFHTVLVDTARAVETVEHTAAGSIRLVGPSEAARVLPGVWARHWPRVVGEVDRTPGWWRALAVDPEAERGGASARFVAVHHDASGVADGFALYRVKQAWGPGGPGHTLEVEAIAGADDAVEAALLRYLLDVDLVGTVRWMVAPLDLPLRWRLADFRALQVTDERDHLWLRPIDVARCLGARRYASEGGLVIEVIDASRPQFGGRFRLDAGPDGAECGRTDAEPGLVLRMPEMGALLLGGVSWTALARAGLIDERVPGTVARADALFATGRSPYCATDF